MDRVDITIIGGGPVGLFASFYAGLRGMSVRILDSLPELGGQLTALYPEKYVYDMPGFPSVLAKDLAADLVRQGTQFNPEVLLEENAETLTADGEGYVIGTRKGLQLPTRTVIIAAGAGAFSPTKMGVPNEEDYEGKGVYYGVREKAQFADKRIVIVGGGDSAFDWALDLVSIAKDVKLVHRRDGFRAHEDTIEKVRKTPVEFKLFYVAKELHGAHRLEAITVENLQTKELERLDVDAVIVTIGFKSSLGTLKEWGLEIEKNQIKVDKLFHTCLPGVFAVGDVATFEGKLKLIATGVGEAATAVCVAKTYIDPAAKLFPGHSSEIERPKA